MRLSNVVHQIGLINTLRLNWQYFGWAGVLHGYIIASRNLVIENLKGSIEVLEKKQRGCIKIGFKRVGICDAKHERAIWNNSGSIIIKDKVDLGSGTRIVNSGTLTFGKNFVAKANCKIICHKKIVFGDDVLISWDTLIMDTDHHKICKIDAPGLQINSPRDIHIGNHVWIGCNVVVLKGTSIADNVIVAAGSIDSGDYPMSNCIISGKIILKDNVIWEY